jgi:hypothetical protein
MSALLRGTPSGAITTTKDALKILKGGRIDVNPIDTWQKLESRRISKKSGSC